MWLAPKCRSVRERVNRKAGEVDQVTIAVERAGIGAREATGLEMERSEVC
jgi:hypothetical protein